MDTSKCSRKDNGAFYQAVNERVIFILFLMILQDKSGKWCIFPGDDILFWEK